MSSADEQTAQVSKLIERLVVDPVFRAQFRADPAEVCRANGLDDLAEEFGSQGRAMYTLEMRESKSSLAGVVMAVAAEGVGVVELKGMLGHGGLHGPAKAAALKALKAGGVKTPHGGAAGLAKAAGLHTPPGGASGKALKSALAHASHAASSGASGSGGSSASGAASAPGAASASPGSAAAGGAGAPAAAPAAGGGAAPAAGGGAAAGAAPAAGGGAAAGAAPAGGGGAAGAVARAGGGGGAGGAAYSATAPAGSGASAASAVPAGGGGAAQAGAAAPAGGTTAPAGSGAGVVEAAGSSGGAGTAAPPQGTGAAAGAATAGAPGAGAGAGAVLAGAGAAAPGGGASTAAIAQLLSSPRLAMPAAAKTLFTSGSVDPRLVSVLENAVGHHTIVLGDMQSVVDPVHAQAIDIVSVDGQPVGPANVGARDLITEIAALDPSLRPSEIGTPWPIQSSGFFTDAQNPNRLHLAFVSQADYQPPAAGGAAAGAVAGGAAPGALPGGAAVGPAPATPAAAGVAQAADAALSAPPPQPAAQAADAAVSAAPPQPGVQQAVSAGVPLSAVHPAPIAASTRGSGVDATLAYARAMIGKLPESAGSNVGPQLDKFEADFGFHGAPWCGIFAGHALEAAGLKVPHSVASVAAILDLARNGDPPFAKGVLPISAARPGDLVTFGGTEHVALVTKIDSAGVHTIAGNTSQSNVSETTYSPSSVTGVVRPDYAAGKPGSIPGVWDYAGVKPPAAAAASAASAASSGPGGAAPAAAPAAAAVSGAPGAGAAAGAGAHAATPEPPKPGTAQFKAVDRHARPHRNTVQFMPAVQPSPGSPLYGQPGAAAPLAEQPAAAGAAGVPVVAHTADASAGGALQQQPGVGAAGLTPAGHAITVNSSLLTPGQEKFAAKLSELTGLDPKVIASWALAEESGGAAQTREAASNFNWLNIGYFDSGPGKIAFDQAFANPVSAAEQTANFLKGKWGGASSSIRSIIDAAGRPPQDQLAAIINSDWTGDSHYGGGGLLHSTFDELGDNIKVVQA